MLKNLSIVAATLLSTVATSAATLPEYRFLNPPPPLPEIDLVTPTQTATIEVAPVQKKEKKLICIGCNINENLALGIFQNKGIKDKNALATIMGNIKQESTFVPNICEGGARVPYNRCRSGGYGLIQFTDAARFHGLGRHAARIGGDPSSLDTQIDYIFTEPQWKNIERLMKVPNKPIDRYMNYAYKWIGWGETGNRIAYARKYSRMLVEAES